MTEDEQTALLAPASERQRINMSPAGRYYPVYVTPRLDDGTVDVRRWCADLDAWFNTGLSGG